jgi:two-component system, NarL family, nitrate/nitrite response regulator NarL
MSAPPADPDLHVLLCDDHRLFAEAWALVLNARGARAVEVCSTGAQCLDALGREPFNVCVVDRQLGDGDGVELIPMIGAAAPDVAVLMVSASTDPALPRLAIEAGARGFASKEFGLEHLSEIVLRVARGERVVERAPSARHAAFEAASLLTARERTVMAKLVEGKDTAQLAQELNITYATARTHIQNVLTKLGVHSKLELVAFAVANQLVAVPVSR